MPRRSRSQVNPHRDSLCAKHHLGDGETSSVKPERHAETKAVADYLAAVKMTLKILAVRRPTPNEWGCGS